MAKEKIVTAIDVGSTKISAVVASLFDNKTTIIGVGVTPSKGINKGNVVDIDSAVESISKSLERAERMAGASIASAFVSISGSHIETVNSHGVVAVGANEDMEITASDVARVTEAAQAVTLPSSREIMHVIPMDFIVDSQSGVKDPVGMCGVRLEVKTNIIHGSAASMRNLVRCVQQTGVHVEELVYTGVASAEAILTNTEKELGVVLVDMGGGTTSIIAFVEGSPVFSSVLPIGGKLITNDLAIGLRARFEDAEKIKIKLSQERADFSIADSSKKGDYLDVTEFGLESDLIPKKYLNEIIDARLKEIFNLVGLELAKANLKGKLPAGIVITGGASLTYGVERVAKNVLKMPARIGTPKGVTGLIDEVQGPDYSANIGTILYAAHLLRTESMLSFDKKKGNIVNNIKSLLDKLRSFLP